MIHPDTRLGFAGAEIGFGVFATRPLPRGTIVWALDELDSILSPSRVHRLGPCYEETLDRYGYVNGSGDRVLCWDIARFVNHSCVANAISSPWDFDVVVRDVEAGEEITNDYGALNLERSFTCHCGAPACRGTIRPGDFGRLADRWDAQMRESFPDVGRVEQPLWSLVRRKRLVAQAARHPERLPSIRNHCYPGADATHPASVSPAAAGVG